MVEGAIAEVFAAALPGLRAEIVRRTVDKLQGLTAQSEGSESLLSAASSIQDTVSQAEILRRLLEGAAQLAGRAALFVVKGKSIAGWLALGFADNESVKSFTLNTVAGLVAQAIQGRMPADGPAADFDAGFAASVGSPADGDCLVVPLVVRQKVAAIIYADAGTTAAGTLDSSGLKLLTRFAALWIELTSLRKAGGPEDPSVATSTVPVASSAPAAPAMSAADAEVHNKARRFAKLLVEEIKLYNGPKVAEGRQSGDLYARLKDDIEKSRATYDKRYAETPAADADHFTEELVRVLADNDASLMGAGFPR